MPKPNTRDAMKRYRAGKAGFTDKAHLKAKGLIPRADGTKKKSPQYEDAPANATGTAVAGTGDDSSTVVVRRKKDKEKMKDRLLRRFKIKETIDRLVPAIEPPTDEVRERVDQLKTLALGEAFTSQQIRQAYGILNDPRYKQGNYSGAVSAIEKLAKGLSKHPDVANALRRANEGFASDAQRRAAFASGYKAKGKKKKKEETDLKEAKYKVDGQLSYKGISGYDGFEVVVNANSEREAEDKAYDALVKARDKRKIGPGGGRGLDDVEFETIELTGDRLSEPSTFRVSEFDPSKDVNEATVTIKSYDTKTGLDRQSEKQMNAVAQRAGAKVKKSGNNVYKVTGDGKQLSKFMANIDQIDGSFMTEENEFIIEFTDKQIARLKKEYESLRGKTRNINPERFKQLRGMMKRFPKANLLKLAKEDIPLLSSGAKAALIMYHGMKWEQLPEEFVPYLELFAEEVDEQKGKFKSIDPKVLARISNMMRGSKEEKQSLANMLNYFMPPEVVDMVRDKFGIKMPRGKIKFTDL